MIRRAQDGLPARVITAIRTSLRTARASMAGSARTYAARLLVWASTSLVILRNRVTRALSTLANFLLTALGLGIAVLLIRNTAGIRTFQHFDTVFVGIGTLIGTMLALVLSLAIIPIQRAVETMTASITSLYRKDATTAGVFALLAAFAIACFVFAVEGALPLSQARTLALAVAMLGISFDLLRWHHRTMTHLLEPGWAIERLAREISNHISYMKRQINLAVRHQLWFQRAASSSVEQIEALCYERLSNHRGLMVAWADALAEVGLRALGRGETNVVKLAITALANQACLYLTARRDNLRLRMEAPMVFGSDIHDVLNPIYEKLKDINRQAVHVRVEVSCIHVVQALELIARHATTLGAKAFPEHTAPISWLPIGYLEQCALAAQLAGLDEPALEAGRSLVAIVAATPENLQTTDVHHPAVEALQKLALRFLLKGNGPLANVLAQRMMAIANNAVARNHFESQTILRHVLEQIELLVPLALTLPEASVASLVPVLSPPYDLNDELSIGRNRSGVRTVENVVGMGSR